MKWTVKIAVACTICLALSCFIIEDSHSEEGSRFMVLIIDKGSSVKTPTVKAIFVDKLEMIDKLYSSKTDDKDYSKKDTAGWNRWRKGLGAMPIGEIMDVKWADKALWFVGKQKSPGWGCVWIDTRLK